MSEVKFKLAAGTNVGLIRTNNEDNFVVCPDLSTSQWLIPQDGEFADLGPYGALLVVADGMGGANAGEVASAIAVQTIQEIFVPNTLKSIVGDEKAIQKFMSDVVKAADLKILNRSTTDSNTRGMGTTVVMAWILGTRAYVCWCGDSRCYALSRRNNQLIQVSKDHSYVQELVDRGELAPEYMHDHPLSNVITRCLGDTEKRAQPETRVFELYDGDTILLCSDGLSGLIYDEHIAAILSEFNEHPMECKNELISAALNNGGHDNVTVAICTVKMGDASIAPHHPATPTSFTTEKEELRATVIPVPIAEPEHDIKEEPVPSSAPEAEPKQEAEAKPEPEQKAEPAPKAESTPKPEPQPVKEEKKEEGVKDDSKAQKAPDAQEKEQKEEAKGEAGKEEQKAEPEKKELQKEEETEKPEPEQGEKTESKKEKSKVKIFLLVLLLLIIAAVCCIYLIPAAEPIRHFISEFINNLSQNLKRK